MRLLDFGDQDAAFEEHRCSQDKNGSVDEQGAVQRNGGIQQIEAAGRALLGGRLPDAAGLHQRRVQVQVMRHHGRPQNADRHV